MPVDDTKDVDQREWPLDVITLPDVPEANESAKLIITHTTIVKDVGTPSETTEHRWEAEMKRGKVRWLIAGAPTQTEFDNQLNTWRQAIVDARNTLPLMV